MDLDPSIENGSVSMDGKWIRIINPCPFKKKLRIILNESTARHALVFLRYHNFMSMARVDLLKKNVYQNQNCGVPTRLFLLKKTT